MKEKGNCVLRKDCFQSEFWCHGPSFLSPHLHAGLPEIWRLVFCSSEAKTAFVFPSLRNNLQRCEIIHQSHCDNFCWLPHTLCIFIIPLFPPQLRGAAGNMSDLLSILQQPQANKSNGTVLTSSVALIIVLTPVSKTSQSSVSSLQSCAQVLHHVPTTEFISCCQIWCDFRKGTAFNGYLTRMSFFIQWPELTNQMFVSQSLCSVSHFPEKRRYFSKCDGLHFQSHSAVFGSIICIKLLLLLCTQAVLTWGEMVCLKHRAEVYWSFPSVTHT